MLLFVIVFQRGGWDPSSLTATVALPCPLPWPCDPAPPRPAQPSPVASPTHKHAKRLEALLATASTCAQSGVLSRHLVSRPEALPAAAVEPDARPASGQSLASRPRSAPRAAHGGTDRCNRRRCLPPGLRRDDQARCEECRPRAERWLSPGPVFSDRGAA